VKSRLLVAAFGIPVVYLATWSEWNRSVFFTLLVIVAITLALSEFYGMVRPYKPYVAAGLLGGIAMPFLAWQAGETGLLAGLVATVPLTLIFYGISAERKDTLAAVAMTLMGVGYISIAGSVIVLLRQYEHGFGLILILLAGTWMTDTGAYFGGRAIGRHKLAPRLSPNKTIEGFVIGTITGVVTVWFSHYLTGEKGDYWLSGQDAVWLGLAISLGATVGDLFESLLKRSANVKDTSTLLGEHGGMLDRVDALLLTGPMLYLGVYVIGVS
jgi:phosphatidate cytidylyltransferase